MLLTNTQLMSDDNNDDNWGDVMFTNKQFWLVVGPPLWKNEFVNWDDEIPNMIIDDNDDDNLFC